MTFFITHSSSKGGSSGSGCVRGTDCSSSGCGDGTTVVVVQWIIVMVVVVQCNKQGPLTL